MTGECVWPNLILCSGPSSAGFLQEEPRLQPSEDGLPHPAEGGVSMLRAGSSAESSPLQVTATRGEVHADHRRRGRPPIGQVNTFFVNSVDVEDGVRCNIVYNLITGKPSARLHHKYKHKVFCSIKALLGEYTTSLYYPD
jgi:hypothetical protein